MPQLDWTMVGVLVTVILAILGAFSTLLWMVRRGDIRRVSSLEDAFKAIRTHSSQLAKLDERIQALDKLGNFLEDLHEDLEKVKDERVVDKEQMAVSSKSIVYLEENQKRMMDIIEKLREEMKDVMVTINGFGRDYVTRKEQQYDTQFRFIQSQMQSPAPTQGDKK